MIIVLFIIFLAMIIIGMKLEDWAGYNHDVVSMLGIGGVILGCIAEFFTVCCIIGCAVCISQLKVADTKIKMYEEENNNIQNSISEIVENYKNYEQNTYSESLKNIDISNTNIVVLAQLYPDLKSNEMVNKQIQVYQDNNNKIKELKENKIDCQTAKWWLYFGNIESE